MKEFATDLLRNPVIRLVIMSVIMDTFFGVGRAIRERDFNSSVGIDGAIRKIAMIISIVFLAGIDKIIGWNLIGFIPKLIEFFPVPEEAINYFADTLVVVGLTEFFGILYLAYECVSILKNMTLCGLPVKPMWQRARNFLVRYTEELPYYAREEDKIDLKEAKQNE